MATISSERITEAIPLLTLAPCPAYFFLSSPLSQRTHRTCLCVFQTVEEIEGVLGRDLYPNLAEERSRWEKELAGLREENESLTAMLCSKEEELNRTKATMNAIREERDRLRRRVSEPSPTWPGLPPGLWGWKTNKHIEPRATPRVLWRS